MDLFINQSGLGATAPTDITGALSVVLGYFGLSLIAYYNLSSGFSDLFVRIIGLSSVLGCYRSFVWLVLVPPLCVSSVSLTCERSIARPDPSCILLKYD